MIEVKCPAVLNDPLNMRKTVFLAGGISNCADWQKEAVAALATSDLILVNPRRDDFDAENPSMTERQIEWEHTHLDMVSTIAFWFPMETLCPITLFELGKYCRDFEKDLIIGCHENYQRIADVKKQMSLARPGMGGIRISTRFQDFIDSLKMHDIFRR